MRKMIILNPKLTLAWLYPELMSTYGDRGNILALKKIAEDNNVNVEIIRIDQLSDPALLKSCDLIFMGGAQDIQQEIVNKDLLNSKGKILIDVIEKNIPGLFVCGAYQFLGKYYKDVYGTQIQGLGIFDMYTESFADRPRLTGNIVINPLPSSFNPHPTTYFVGFENHGGRTYLRDKAQAFAKVVKGFGNNGGDKTEGIIYKNSIGTYLHGPILPANPQLAIKLLELALEKKYDKKVDLIYSSQTAANAKKILLKRLNISY